MTINKCQIYNCLIVVFDLNTYNIIIKNNLLKRFKIKLDPLSNCFLWPSTYLPTPTFTKEILISFDSNKSPWKVQDYQVDTNQRILALEINKQQR